MSSLEQQLNAALQSRIPPKLRNGRHRLAIDLHLIPYYGKPTDIEANYVYRSQAKAGTTRFFAYATVYAICRSRRGGQLVYHALFPLNIMLQFLSTAVERRFPVVTAIYLPVLD